MTDADLNDMDLSRLSHNNYQAHADTNLQPQTMMDVIKGHQKSVSHYSGDESYSNGANSQSLNTGCFNQSK
jgi:hypothetical protein